MRRCSVQSAGWRGGSWATNPTEYNTKITHVVQSNYYSVYTNRSSPRGYVQRARRRSLMLSLQNKNSEHVLKAFDSAQMNTRYSSLWQFETKKRLQMLVSIHRWSTEKIRCVFCSWLQWRHSRRCFTQLPVCLSH